jgi:hypothetical protein
MPRHVLHETGIKRLFEHLPDSDLVRYFRDEFVPFYEGYISNDPMPHGNRQYFELIGFLLNHPFNDAWFYLQMMKQADYIFNEEDRIIWNEAIARMEKAINRFYTGLPKKEGD